jgi:hypothetical protein
MRAALMFSLFALWALAFPALAGDSRDRQSLDRVLPEIRRTTPGTFYDAEGPFLMPNGQVTYRIKWMTPAGRVVWFYADARSGHVLGMAQQPRFRNEPPPGHDSDWRDGRDRSDWRDRNDWQGRDENWNRDDRRNRDDTWNRDRRDDRWNRDRSGQDRGGRDWNNGRNHNNGDRGGRGRHPGG